MSSIYLGLDTSCYTTSIAAVNEDGQLLAEKRRLLRVGEGEKGLQQSAALFQHVQNLPQLITELGSDVDFSKVRGVAASTRPRPVEGSYMPVFTVSAGHGMAASRLLSVPFVETSHQEGHLSAGLWSAGGPHSERFMAVHLSGGTTELLVVQRLSVRAGEPLFEIKLLGGSTDLHAGQFVDRVGVRLGLPFPAGPKLEILARDGEQGRGLIPSSVQGYSVSFSGPEAHARRLLEKGIPPAQVARAVEACIAKTLVKLIGRGMQDEGLKEILVVGGVAANSYIRTQLRTQLEHNGAMLHFAAPKYSSDNAVGVALIGQKIVEENQ